MDVEGKTQEEVTPLIFCCSAVRCSLMFALFFAALLSRVRNTIRNLRIFLQESQNSHPKAEAERERAGEMRIVISFF